MAIYLKSTEKIMTRRIMIVLVAPSNLINLLENGSYSDFKIHIQRKYGNRLTIPMKWSGANR